jgi:hypothetical protein
MTALLRSADKGTLSQLLVEASRPLDRKAGARFHRVVPHMTGVNTAILGLTKRLA